MISINKIPAPFKAKNRQGWGLGLSSATLMLGSFSAFAEATPAQLSHNLAPSDYFGQILMSLIIILVVIFAAAWLVKRFGRMNGLASNHMQVLGNMSVGQRERIILLEVGKEQLLIGVTASEIRLLHELKEPLDIGNAATIPGDFKGGLSQVFAQKLQEAMIRYKTVKDEGKVGSKKDILEENSDKTNPSQAGKTDEKSVKKRQS